MNGQRGDDTARFRLLKAVAVVLAIMLAAPGADAIATFLGASVAEEGAYGGIDSAWILSAPDAFAALDRAEEAVGSGDAEPPDSFLRESVLPDARDFRVSSDGSVAGYVVRGEAPEVLGRLTSCMESAGWVAVPLGEVTGATFVRPEGDRAWLLASCTQVGEVTSVVMRSVSP